MGTGVKFFGNESPILAERSRRSGSSENHMKSSMVYGDHRVDILPRRFQKLNPRPGEPQRLEDVSLDRLLGIVGQEFETHDVLQIWGRTRQTPL